MVIGRVKTDVDKYSKETHFLMYMTKVHQKSKEKLLLHPLVQAYVYIKWKSVSILFTLLTLLYVRNAQDSDLKIDVQKTM